MHFPLESQCCNRELALRLRELGVPQESLFYYALFNGKWEPTYVNDLRRGSKEPVSSFVAAFTVAELYDMLPNRFTYLIGGTNEGKTRLAAWPGATNDFDDVLVNAFDSDTLADAIAKALIYLYDR
jgi:hypothetical protein